ncbi:MAG: hypothetical protein QOG10_850 [Kribbellaceae bacterium]|jgi:hypothetical protein|nr:hypothetical protein [Kribbellaceae bacterium]
MRSLLVVVALLGLAACGTQPVPQVAELPPLPAGGKPFDLFRRADLGLIEKADLQLFNDCLAKAGYPQERALSAGPDPVVPALLRPAISPRTEAEARKYGFGTPMRAQPATIVRKEPAFHETAASCEKSAREPLGPPDEVGALRDRYFELGNALVKDRGKSVQAIVLAHSLALTDCLAAKGYRLKRGEQFNVRGDLSQFGITRGSYAAVRPVQRRVDLPVGDEVQPAVPAREYRPSTAEVAFAVTFVRCGGAVGLFGALDKAEVTVQQEIVERHASEFSGLNPRIEALAQKAAEVLRAR